MGRWVRRLGYLFAAAAATSACTGLWLALAPMPDYSATPLPNIHALDDPAVVERGRYVFHGPAHCAHCHAGPEAEITRHQAEPPSGDLGGGSPIDGTPIGWLYPANLTSDPTGLADRSDGEIARAIRTGVLHDGQLGIVMTTSVGDVSDEDLVALVSYIRTIPPVHREVPREAFGFVGRTLARLFSPRAAKPVADVPPGDVSVDRGRYLAMHVAKCADCHTARNEVLGTYTSPLFAGGTPFADRTDRRFEFAPPNLTPDPTTGRIADWTEDASSPGSGTAGRCATARCPGRRSAS